MADVIGLYRRAVDEFGARVRAVGDDQWALPTPDADWDVRALVGHVLSENQWVAPLLEGLTIEEVGNRFEGDQLGDDPVAAWARTSADALAACEPDDVPLRVIHMGMGDITGEDYLAQITTDHVIHAWDLARATGGDERLDPELVDFAYGYLAPQAEHWRAAGAFGPAMKAPTGSDRQAEVLALTGRDPLGTGEVADVAPAGGSDPDSDSGSGSGGGGDSEGAGDPSGAGDGDGGGDPGAEVELSPVERLQSDLAMLAAQARSIQAELDSYTTTRNHYWATKAEDWTTDLGRYDRVLITMAVLLGYPVPPHPPQGAQRRLSREERAAMQKLLADNDVDLGLPAPS